MTVLMAYIFIFIGSISHSNRQTSCITKELLNSHYNTSFFLSCHANKLLLLLLLLLLMCNFCNL